MHEYRPTYYKGGPVTDMRIACSYPGVSPDLNFYPERHEAFLEI